MKRTPTCLALALAIISCGAFTQASAAEGPSNFEKVIPFTTATGRLGFFDQNNGSIVVYDENWKHCVFTGQLKTLGAPLEEITGTATDADSDETPLSGKNISIDAKGGKTITLSGDRD